MNIFGRGGLLVRFMLWAIPGAREALELEVQKLRYAILQEKANNLARLVERIAYAPVSSYYEERGNDAPLRLLRLAVEDIDLVAQKGGTRE